MLDQLWSRFDDESGSWVYDPALHLSYNDRERIDAGPSAEVAREKRALIARRLWRLTVAAGAALMLLLGGIILMALSAPDVVSTATLEEIVSPLSIAFSLGLGGPRAEAGAATAALRAGNCSLRRALGRRAYLRGPRASRGLTGRWSLWISRPEARCHCMALTAKQPAQSRHPEWGGTQAECPEPRQRPQRGLGPHAEKESKREAH